MIIMFWIFLRFLFIGLLALLIVIAITNKFTQEALQTLWNGIKEGLRGSGFLFPSKNEVELYRWVVTDEEHVCDDGIERASWPPMDIADWMKAGLPGTPEADTDCGSECSCKLLRCDRTDQKK